MKQEIIRGRTYLFGDNINTDFINPAQYMELPMDQMIQHAMEGADPDFSKNVRPGDVMVAGINFGSGSSRETAQIALIYAGVGAVIAKDFARIFFRNCINVGLPVVNFAATDKLNQGDEIRVDFLSGVIEDLTTGETYHGSRLPENVLAIVQDGGLKEHLKKSLKK